MKSRPSRPSSSRPGRPGGARPSRPSGRGLASSRPGGRPPAKAPRPAARHTDDTAEGGGPIRLQKLLSMSGVASRRAAEVLIGEGRVTVNGVTVTTLGAKATPGVDDVRVDDRRVAPPGAAACGGAGRRVKAAPPARYIMLNKPKGYVTTRRDPQKRRTVMDLIGGIREYVYPVGRLDFDTEGLLILTSDGDLAAKLTHPRHDVPRVYEAIVTGVPDDETIDILRRGVYLDDRRTREAGVTRGATVHTGRIPTTKLILTLFEGRNRQVREMCAQVGHPVRTLQRVRYGSLTLRGLPVGAWRDLTTEEVGKLRESVG